MLADRIHRINPSATLEMTAKAAELKRLNQPVYNMSVGEPDFSTPLNIQKAAQFAIANDHTKYTPGSGTHELKSAIVTKIKKDQRIDYPAQGISNQVQENWNKNFKNDIDIVIGQAWWAGNLSYHLESRPKYIGGYLDFVKEKLSPNDGVVYIEDESSKLTKSCPGVSFVTYSLYICMVGTK